MRVAFLVSSILLFFFPSQIPSVLQPERDPQAVALLQQSIGALAKTVPADSSASGIVTVVEGSTTQTGTIQISTLGTNETSEALSLPEQQRAVIYSSGASKETWGTQSTSPNMELVLTDQCPDFPLPFLISVLGNPDESIRYVGLETLGGQSVQHVQFWNSFASKPHLQSLAAFSLKDLWINESSGLPLKIAFSRRAAGGAAPSFPVEVTFSNYTNVGGVLYPFQINKSYNGTPWQTITIQSVSFNTGLTSTQFQVE
jgi:hypothetical protein